MENKKFQELISRINQHIYFDENSAERYLKAKSIPIIGDFLLADYFNYNLTKGGFAQLLYNLKGEYIEEIEELLSRMNAKTALSFYKKAIFLCLEKQEEYQQFISDNYLENNVVKNDLHMISVEYFNQKIDLEEEIAEFISSNYSEIIKEIKNLN